MSTDDRSAGSALRVALWSGAVAVVVRLVAAVQEVRSAFFGFAILDERYYDGVARTLLGWPGGVLADGFRPLGYPGLLAAVYGFAGPDAGPAAAILVQHLLGTATGVLVALCARRWARSEAAGLAAGLLWALAGPPLFFEGQLLATTLFTFLTFLQVFIVTGPVGASRRALAGGLTGLLARVRPNGLLLGVAYLVAPLWEKGRRGFRLAAAALLALVAVYLAGSLVEVPWTQAWVPLSASGGSTSISATSEAPMAWCHARTSRCPPPSHTSTPSKRGRCRSSSAPGPDRARPWEPHRATGSGAPSGRFAPVPPAGCA
ncbi:MAG: hypothetical protein R2991_13500 [Thermoanaerobaculia bacterium]